MLSTRFDVYRDVILVALALHSHLDSLPKVLDGDARQAAFALSDALGAGAPTPTLPWSVEDLQLSESFQHIWDNMKVQSEFEDRKRVGGGKGYTAPGTAASTALAGHSPTPSFAESPNSLKAVTTPPPVTL